MSEDYPYRVEYATEPRSSCRHCRIRIADGSLRLAALVQSFHQDGKDAHWYHDYCFFIKQRPLSTAQIDHFESIRIRDQRSIIERIENISTIPKATKATKGKKRPLEAKVKKINIIIDDFGVEYAKSGRSLCCGCQVKIMKDEVRVKKIFYDTEVGMKFGGQPFWHHLDCFSKLRSDYDYYISGKKLPGFKKLAKDDQVSVLNLLPEVSPDVSQAKKSKKEPKTALELTAEKKLEETISLQSNIFYDWMAKIQKYAVHGLQQFLFVNESGITGSKEEMQERVADFLSFGALEKCNVCKNGDFVFKKNGYVCNGSYSEWARCENKIEKPPRKVCNLPPEWMKTGEPWSSFYSNIEDRAVRAAVAIVPEKWHHSKVIMENGVEIRKPRVQRERPALYNMHIVIIGKTKTDKPELKKTIARMGGKVVGTLQERIAFVISNPEEVVKMNSRMRKVKELNIQVVPESFIEIVKAGDAIEMIKSSSICDWGSDPLARIPQEEAVILGESIYTKFASKKATMTLKGGSAVDPKSDLVDTAHVYKDKDILYSVVLGLTDIQRGKNSYHKLQVLKSDKGNKFWFFQSWGRIGTTVGDSEVEMYSMAESACDHFSEMYSEKTGNPWSYNGTDSFKKKAMRFCPIDVDYEEDEKTKKMTEDSTIKSELSEQVQDLMKMLFDVESMKRAMMEFELDLEKMPLGRLSKKQLQSAYTCLTDLNKLIEKGGSNAEFIGYSNKFYTLVPHNFGVKNPPLIDTVEMIKNKIDMIDNLMEIEIAYNLMNADTDEEKNPLDAHYEQLKTELVALKKDSEEFQLIEKYVQNTHAATHDTYTLDVEDVFKLKRKGEKRRYKPFNKLHNRQLLWHGSRLTNYVGILSHGLKIAPPEAPVTGYMFGKGIYFADMVSKSANYCYTSKENSTGLMLLSEVALGDTHDLTKATYIESLPKDKHSTKGIGKTQPNPAEFHTRKDGVVIPLGTPFNDPQLKTELLYNEYIVYDVGQVNIQYMLKLKFNYKNSVKR